MAEKKVIEIEIQDNSKTLKQQYKEAVLEVQKLADAFGATSVEVQNASKRAAELKDQIEDVNDAIQSQKGEGAFIALGKSISSVASGFSAVEGAMGLVGAQSEDVQQAMLRVQSAMALAQGLGGLEDAGRSFKQLGAVIKSTAVGQNILTAATTAYTFVTSAATAGLKLFRLALISTGIGALIVGVGLLVANFEKLVDIGKLVTDFLGITDSKAEKRAENDMRRTNAELKNIERAKKARKKAYDEETGNIDRQIKLLEAQGKSTEALEKLQLKRSLTNQRELIKEARLNLQILRATNIGGINDEMIEETITAIAEMKQAILNTETDIKIARINNAKDTKKEIDKIEAVDLTKDPNYIAEQDRLAAENAAELKAISDIQKANAEANKLKIQQEQEYLNEIEAIQENNFQFGLTEQQREIQAVNDKYFRLQELAKGNAEELKIIEQAKANELGVINDKYTKEEIARQNELRQTRLKMTADAFSAIGDLVGSFNAKNDKDARKQFEIQKAFNLAAAITNTAMAVTGALTAGGNPIKLATGQQFIEAGIAGTIGLANIMKIASSRFGGGASGGGGGIGATGGNVIAPNLNVVGDTGINQLATLQQQPIKAYVVSNDITSAQQFDLKVQQTASL